MSDSRASPLSAPSYRTAGAVSAAALLLYLVTLSPTIGLWDAGEYVAAAARLGIPHPPGNPGFVLLGRVVALLPIARTVAGRLNVLVALASALSAGLWFLVTEHVARNWLSPSRARVAGAATALVGASAFTVWNQSVVNEKVYTVSLFLLTLDLWTTLLWQSDPDGPAADKRLGLLCYRLGIGYTIHIAGLLAGPALLAAVLYTKPRTLRRPRLLALCAALFVLGLTPYAMLPIRSAFRLEINEGHPSACEDGAPHWGCTVSRETLDRFLYENNRTQYAKPSLLDRQQSLPNQVRMWWLYFKWQWFRDPAGMSPDWQSAIAVAVLLLAGAGGYTHWKADRRSFVPFATLIATLTAGLIYYLNFKLGYSQAMAMGVQDPRLHEVRDRDYFYLWSYSALSVWIGLGLAFVWRRIAELVAGSGGLDGRAAVVPRPRHWHIAGPVMCVALVPLIVNWSAASRRKETFAEDFAVDALNSVEPNGVLFTGGDNDSFPLWYAQQVLGVRRDVTIVLLAYLATDWYVRELIVKTPEPYDAARGPAIYRNFPARPLTPVLALTRSEANAIPQEMQTGASRAQLNGFQVDIPPTMLTRDVVVMLRIIHDAGVNRPIYFSSGAGTPAMDKYLGGHLITHGLARKLVADPAAEPGAVNTGIGYVDVPRTLALWQSFRGPAGLERQGRWVDIPSVNAPYLYMRVGLGVSDGLDSTYALQAPRMGFVLPQKGDSARPAQVVRAQVQRIGAALDLLTVVRERKNVLEAPTGLGYAPVTGP
ncbi:MAG: hypothetical protein JWM95_3186 [Gemmatimonadetes bacterium]|nr:hypothetical protein [Gemmatimonadota bacterium]